MAAASDGAGSPGRGDGAAATAGWMSAPASELPGLIRSTALQVMMVQNLDQDKPFMEAGMDSIESVDFRNELERELPGISLSGALVLEHPTVRELAAHVARKREEIGAVSADAASKAPSATTLLDAELQEADGTVRLPAYFPDPAPARKRAAGGAVLLTGATGFLGIHLLAELLECTKSEASPPKILVVIRASSVLTGGQRVRSSLAEHGLSLSQAEWDRVRVLPTQDLGLPGLGLGESGFQELRRPELGLHTIVHNAAQVNWFRAYDQLRSTNVGTTLELLQLAAELGAKFGYVSSISTLPLSNLELAVDEGCDNSWRSVDVLKMSSYSQTKWVSEQLCRAACHRGVAVSIFRMPFIVGNTRTGCLNLQDTPARMIQAVVELQEAPVSVQLDCVAVDVVARVTARASLRPGTLGVDPQTGQLLEGSPSHCVVHIATKFGKLGMEKIFEQLRRCGYNQLRWVSRSEWVRKAMSQKTAAAPIQVFDRLFNRPALLNSMRTEDLEAMEVELRNIMEVTPEQLKVTIRFLQAGGAMAQPSRIPSPGSAAVGSSASAARQKLLADEARQSRPPLDYDGCRRSCLEDPGRYHGAVAGRNLHWYHSGREAWLTWRPLDDDQTEDRLGWAFPGGWRGFAASPGTGSAIAEAEAEPEWLPWTTALDDSAAPFYRWFVGAQTNAAMNEVDRHIANGFGSETAHIIDLSRPLGSRPEEQRITRRQLLVESAIAAAVLAQEPLGLRRGDRALLFLPTTVEQLVWTEACKRLGVIYSACTPGLVAGVLAERLCELQAAVLITARNPKDPRWSANVASAAGDFAPVRWLMDAVEAVAGELRSGSWRDLEAELATGGAAASASLAADLAAAVMEAHAALQEAFGASRCASLSAALAQVKKEVTDRVGALFADGDGLVLVLSRLEKAVQSICEDRAKGNRLKVLVLDAPVPTDASASGAAGASQKQPDLFGSGARCIFASELRAAALGASGGTLVDAVETLGEVPDAELLPSVWQEAGRPAPVEANFPLFICYTSGSSTKPHGIVHCHGYQAGLVETLHWVFDAEPGKDRMLSISHPGWIVGQSYIYAAPLCARITSVAMEGSPIRPSHMRFAEVIERYSITILKTGSTFLREVMSYPQAVQALRTDYDFSCVKVATFCSEPLSPQVQAFAMQHLCPQYVNSYWSTEHGGITWSRCWGNQDQLLISNTHSWPLPWISAEVLCLDEGGGIPRPPSPAGERALARSASLSAADAAGAEPAQETARAAHPGESGDVAIMRPYPYQFRCVWGDPQHVMEPGWRGDADATVKRYWHRVRVGSAGPCLAFVQHDWAQKHHSGAYTFHGRSDEVMNLCGITVGTETIESAVLRDKHLQPDSPVGDCAVVGHPHVVYGEMPLAFVTPSAPDAVLQESDRRRLSGLVFEAVGNVGLQFVQVPELPRTQTGKILRSILHALIRDDRDAFLRGSRAVQNPHCLRNVQVQLREWRQLHAHFTSATGQLAQPALPKVLTATHISEESSPLSSARRSPDSEAGEFAPPPAEEPLRGGQLRSCEASGSGGRGADATPAAAGAAAGDPAVPPAAAVARAGLGRRRRRRRSRSDEREESEEESDDDSEDEDASDARWRRRRRRRRPRERHREPWEVTLDLRLLGAFGAGAALMAAVAAVIGLQRRPSGGA